MIASSTIISWRTPARAAEYAASIASCWRKGMAHRPEAYQEGASEEQAGASLTQIMDAPRGGDPSPRPGRRASGQRVTRDQVSTAGLPLTGPEGLTNAGLHLRVRPERIRAGPGLDRGPGCWKRARTDRAWRAWMGGLPAGGRRPGAGRSAAEAVLLTDRGRRRTGPHRAGPGPASARPPRPGHCMRVTTGRRRARGLATSAGPKWEPSRWQARSDDVIRTMTRLLTCADTI
jgi:hypothetical protein